MLPTRKRTLCGSIPRESSCRIAIWERCSRRRPSEQPKTLPCKTLALTSPFCSFDLVKNPDHEARIVVRKLGSADPAALKQTTFSLRSQLTDVAFRTAFIRADGIPALQAIIRRGSGNTLAYALASLHVLLDTDGLTFDSLFIARLVDIVGGSSSPESDCLQKD